jgi:CRP-like cAMP-binding protein
LRKIPLFREFQSEELEFVEWFKSGELVSDEGATVLMEGHSSPHLYTVLSGWAFRFKTLPDGRRQILNFALPGDFLGLQTSMFNEMQHSVETLTKTVLCVFPRDKIWTLYEKFPSLAYDLTWIASRSERLLDEQLLAVGRRSALERVAFVLQHLFDRAHSIGLTDGNSVEFPFTQQHLADALGLSLVHTNKTLKILTDRKYINWKDGTFTFLDRAAMVALSSYERESTALRPLI